MELQQILSKMEADGWEISNDFKIAHGHFLQYFLETVEEALRQPHVSGELADFVQFLADEYSMKVPERVVDEWEKYYSANYR